MLKYLIAKQNVSKERLEGETDACNRQHYASFQWRKVMVVDVSIVWEEKWMFS